MSREYDAVIVGGGAAGVGAARRLASRGTSVLVLEAMPRLGGRAWTRDLGGHPLDLGCGWLHSGDRNAWVAVADSLGFQVERRDAAWGSPVANLRFGETELAAARQAYRAWNEALYRIAGTSDRASDALEPGGSWNAYVEAMAGFMSGVDPDRISIADFTAYDTASTGRNWRIPLGYGTVVAAALPPSVDVRTATPVKRIATGRDGVALDTPDGTVRARTAIITVSTAVLSGGALKLPRGIVPWREAAAKLPLGRNEKIFLQVREGAAFEAESHVFGNLHAAGTAAYHIRPLGRPIIEAFLGGEGAAMLAEEGSAAGFAHATDELAALFGNDVRSKIRPLLATDWSRMAPIGGAYSCALPYHAAARASLARPFEERIFFAGEATNSTDFSTAHGAHDSGVRAADEVLKRYGC